jgi:hypothetical protein
MTRRLVVTTRLGLPPGVLEDAIASAAASGDPLLVVIPVTIPPTLPASAAPPRLARRVGELRERARRALVDLGADGRILVVPCRDRAAAVHRLCGRRPPAEIVFAGPASWPLRRALHGLAPLTIVSGRRERGRRRVPLPTAAWLRRPAPGRHAAE